MIPALDPRGARSSAPTETTVVPLAGRMDSAEEEVGGISLIEERTRHIPVQQFMEALMQGDPELTGVPPVSLDGEY